MEGTVSDIRGYPLYCFIKEARSPAVAAPIKAAAAAGIHVKSISLNIRCCILPRCKVVNSSGCKCNNNAIIHANTVATSTIIIEYINRSRPDRKSSLARSIPLVIKGNPGIINSIEHM